MQPSCSADFQSAGVGDFDSSPRQPSAPDFPPQDLASPQALPIGNRRPQQVGNLRYVTCLIPLSRRDIPKIAPPFLTVGQRTMTRPVPKGRVNKNPSKKPAIPHFPRNATLYFARVRSRRRLADLRSADFQSAESQVSNLQRLDDHAPPILHRRSPPVCGPCRLEIGYTAGWKPALLLFAGFNSLVPIST